MPQVVIDGRARELIGKLYSPLRRFAATVGSYDIEPDDLVQEALLRTLRRGQLHELDNPRAYVSRAIVNIASNQRRSAARRRRVLALVSDTGAVTDSYPSDLDDLESLGPQARAVLYLVEVEGFDFKAVASMVGVRSANARKIAERARRQLRGLLEESVQ